MIERCVDAVGRAAAWLNLGMVAITCIVVALRYVFDAGAIFLQESVVYMHGAAFLVGFSFALKHDAHVRVDVFYSRLSQRSRAGVNLAGHLLLLVPLAATILVASWSYAVESWVVLEGSQEVDGVPAVFVLKTLIPFSAALLLAQGAAMAWADWHQLGAPTRGEDASP